MDIDLGERERFESVVNVVFEPLQRYFARRTSPDDVSELLNDVLLVIWRRLDQVPADDPLPWSYGVAKRCLANHRRGSERRLRLVGKLTDHACHDVIALGTPNAEVENPRLNAALGELRESDRELVRLWAWEQLEPRQIAVALDITPNAVSLRLARAKKSIFSSMERQNRGAAGQEGFGHRREHRS